MTEEKLGQEPAFARIDNLHAYQDGVLEYGSPGMSKRFYAACAVMNGMLANNKQSKYRTNIFVRILQMFLPGMTLLWSNSDYDTITTECYNIVDELLKQENE